MYLNPETFNVLVLGPQSLAHTKENYNSLAAAIDSKINLHNIANKPIIIKVGDGFGVDSIVRDYADSLKAQKRGKLTGFSNTLFDANKLPLSKYHLLKDYKRLINKTGPMYYDLVILCSCEHGFFNRLDDESGIKQLEKHCLNKGIPVSTHDLVIEPMNIRCMNLAEVTDSQYIPLEYDICGDSVGFFGDDALLNMLSMYPELPSAILAKSHQSTLPRLIHLESIYGDRTQFIAIPIAVNHKFITSSQYMVNILRLRELVDMYGMTNVYLPRLGNSMLNGEWERRGGEICDELFDSRFTIMYPVMEYTTEYEQHGDRSLQMHESSKLYSAYEAANRIDCSQGFDHIINQFVNIKAELIKTYTDDESTSNDEILDKTNKDLQCVIEFLFSKQNARKYLLKDFSEVIDIEDKLRYTEHLIRNWAEDQSETDYLRKMDKSRLYLGNFNISNMITEILVKLQAMKIKSSGPVLLSALANSCVKFTPFGKKFEQTKGDSEFLAKKRASELTSDVIALMAETELLRFCKTPRSQTRSDGFKFIANMWAVDTNDFASETTMAIADLSMTLPPIIGKPQIVKSNGESAYRTTRSHVISNPYHQHDGELCLDSINQFNGTKFSLDMDSVLANEQKFKKPKDWNLLTKKEQDKVKENWQRQMKISEFVHELMYRLGNEFSFNWFYDYRGRLYSSGYHISFQGDDYKKAALTFANKQRVFANITDAEEKECLDFLDSLEPIELPFS